MSDPLARTRSYAEASSRPLHVDGQTLVTSIAGAMTMYHRDGRTGIGMSDYLDQLRDGFPVGPDVESPG